MLLVDQISSSRNENRSPSERNVTATIGLVVHAAGNFIVNLITFVHLQICPYVL